MKILIAGCGDIGTHLGLQLADLGHEVYGITRTTRLPSSLHTLHFDLANSAEKLQLPDNIDYVFYTAAAKSFSEDTYRQTYVDGLQNLLNAIAHQKQNIKRIFFTSSTAVYDQCDGEVVNEDSSTNPVNFSGQLMLRAENILKQSHFPACIIRCSGIYGGARRSLIDRIKANDAKLSLANPYSNRIHRDDLVGILLHLMAMPNPDTIYIASDTEPTKINDIMHWLAKQYDIQLAPAEDQSASAQRGNKRCDSRKIQRTGYRFKYPSFKEGYSVEEHSQ